MSWVFKIIFEFLVIVLGKKEIGVEWNREIEISGVREEEIDGGK